MLGQGTRFRHMYISQHSRFIIRKSGLHNRSGCQDNLIMSKIEDISLSSQRHSWKTWTLKMNAARSSETLLNIYRPTWRHIPKYFESPSITVVRTSYVACSDVTGFRDFVIFLLPMLRSMQVINTMLHLVLPLKSTNFLFCFTKAERIKILTNSYNDTNEIQHPNAAYVCCELLQ